MSSLEPFVPLTIVLYAILKVKKKSFNKQDITKLTIICLFFDAVISISNTFNRQLSMIY